MDFRFIAEKNDIIWTSYITKMNKNEKYSNIKPFETLAIRCYKRGFNNMWQKSAPHVHGKEHFAASLIGTLLKALSGVTLKFSSSPPTFFSPSMHTAQSSVCWNNPVTSNNIKVTPSGKLTWQYNYPPFFHRKCILKGGPCFIAMSVYRSLSFS